MVGLFFILFLAATIFFIVKTIKEYKGSDGNEDVCFFYIIMATIFGVVSIIFLIWVFILVGTIGTGHTIDDKIAMYEAENTSIEETIDATVRNYMDFETTTYEKFKDEDSMSLISLFPELKSDTLVSQQIEIYVANNQRIKSLKEEKIDLSKAKFKLYFGR